MNKPALKRVEELFHQALALGAEERPEFLDDVCFGEPELRAAVEELLRLDQDDDDTHEIRVGPVAAAAEELGSDAPTIINPNPDLIHPDNRVFPQIPGYELVEELGRGGMGIVYKAKQTSLNRVVALKMLLEGGLAGQETLERFRAEAQVLARLQHPNIVSIYDINEYEGRPYFAMEFVKGPSLARILDGRPQPIPASAHCIEILARTIHAVHQCGIIHRDLKPANILLQKDEGRRMKDEEETASPSGSSFILLPSSFSPKITDFGIAKDETKKDLTRTGQTMGTPCYMAPEQARGHGTAVGPAADTYALGSILYEMLTGRPPFEAETSAETIALVLHEEPIPPWRLRPRLPHDLGTICLKCLEKSPGSRYASALDLAEDLRRFQAHEVIRARPVGMVERLYRWCRRKPQVAALTALLAVVLVAFMVTIVVFDIRLQEEVRKQRHQIIELNINLGIDEEEAGDTLAALLRFTEALRFEEILSEDQSNDRIRIALALQQCPRLVRLLTLDLPALASDRPDLPCHARHLRLSLEGKGLSSPEGTSDQIWQARSGELRVNFSWVQPGIADARINRDGRLELEAGAEGLRIWDTEGGQAVTSLSDHERLQTSALSPDGKRIVVVDRTGVISIWELPEPGRETAMADADLTRGTPMSPPQPGEVRLKNAAFSPDGSCALVCENKRVARLCNPATGELMSPPLTHREELICGTFSPDGRLVVTASVDRTIRVWDCATRRPLSPPLAHGLPIKDVVFRKDDSTRVLVLHEDGTMSSWNLSPDERSVEQLVALAQLLECSRIDENEDEKPLEKNDLRAAWMKTQLIR
jgi:serine/threonine protein kinase